jgi:mRNA interferase HigB
MMRLIGQDVVARAIRKHRDAQRWLAGWVATVEEAHWSNLDELRDDYPSADGVAMRSGLVITVFNVKGNEYRLLTRVDYRIELVQVLELLTHAEYSKDRWKGRY